MLLFTGGCADGDSVPSTLMDGSPASKPRVELESLAGDPVLTKVVVVDSEEIPEGSRAGDCFREGASGARPFGRIVERVGISSESVTLRDASGLYACDNSSGQREADRRWCGGSFGRLYDERLRDPRLHIGCSTADGEHMGFVWVQPLEDAQYVAVEQPGYSEVYEVAGELPVRIATTTDVDVEGSRATFDLSEHDAAGRLLRRYSLEAAVAG